MLYSTITINWIKFQLCKMRSRSFQLKPQAIRSSNQRMYESCNCQQLWKQTWMFTDKTDRWSKCTQMCIYIFTKGEHYDGIIPKPISHNENASPDFASLHWKTDGVCSYLNICTYLENSCVMTNNQPSMDIENSIMSLKQRHDKSVFLQEMPDFRECNPKNMIVDEVWRSIV